MAEISRISRGCATTNSRLKNPPLCIPCRPRTSVQSLNSEKSSSNSSHTSLITVVLFDQPDAFSTGVRPYSILASNGSDLSDSSKNNCDKPTPYARTVVITSDERKTPVITARPLSLPLHAPCAARRSLLGNSVTLFWNFENFDRFMSKSESSRSMSMPVILPHRPRQDPMLNVCRMLRFSRLSVEAFYLH